jgi:hypothetical protein
VAVTIEIELERLAENERDGTLLRLGDVFEFFFGVGIDGDTQRNQA